MPVLTWANPADIVYGTALGAAQLDATASFGGSPVAGTFAYTPAAGHRPERRARAELSVTFTPNDTTDYNAATANVVINVAPRH